VEIESFRGKVDPAFSSLQKQWSYLDTRETSEEADSSLGETNVSLTSIC
jgi:hypothetical protein